MPSTGRIWRAYESGICHYCGGKATTDDHIVPRKILPKPQSLLPYWFRAYNIVPACSPCNNYKGWFRSDCECDACRWAWNTAIRYPFILPEYEVPPVIKVLRSGT